MARILVIEDEVDLCEILQFNLEQDGHQVDIAHSAEAAMKMDDLAESAGFNSLSTFYAAFKKHTQLTPAKYKALHLAVTFPVSEQKIPDL